MYRYANLRCDCLPVVMYDGQVAERKAADASFKALYWRMRSLFKSSFYLTFFVTAQNTLFPTLSMFVIVLLIIRTGAVNGSVVTPANVQEAWNGLTQLILGLSQLPMVYSQVGTIAGLTHRVSQLLEVLEALQVRHHS